MQIISLAQGAEKAVAVVTAIVKSEYVATNIVRTSFFYPVLPITSDGVAITYFPMSDVYSIACDEF